MVILDLKIDANEWFSEIAIAMRLTIYDYDYRA